MRAPIARTYEGDRLEFKGNEFEYSIGQTRDEPTVPYFLFILTPSMGFHKHKMRSSGVRMNATKKRSD